MAADLTRCYNRSFDQLREAVWRAFQRSHPGSGFHEPQPGWFTMKLGMRWPFTSYGEVLEVRLSAPGVVGISSRYQMPTQIFELGDNVENAELLARRLDECCAMLPVCCPTCGGAPVEPRGAFCTHCGGAFHDEAAQEPVPSRARHVRIVSFIVSLVIVLLFVGLCALLPLAMDHLLG